MHPYTEPCTPGGSCPDTGKATSHSPCESGQLNTDVIMREGWIRKQESGKNLRRLLPWTNIKPHSRFVVEGWQSGRMRMTRNHVSGLAGPGVRIPPPPPQFWAGIRRAGHVKPNGVCFAMRIENSPSGTGVIVEKGMSPKRPSTRGDARAYNRFSLARREFPGTGSTRIMAHTMIFFGSPRVPDSYAVSPGERPLG